LNRQLALVVGEVCLGETIVSVEGLWIGFDIELEDFNRLFDFAGAQ